MSKTNTFDIEEYLQSKIVFISGINGRRTHMDSYMTIIDFTALQNAVKENSYTREDWTEAARYWAAMGYLSPTIKLLSITIKRWLDENSFFPETQSIKEK